MKFFSQEKNLEKFLDLAEKLKIVGINSEKIGECSVKSPEISPPKSKTPDVFQKATSNAEPRDTGLGKLTNEEISTGFRLLTQNNLVKSTTNSPRNSPNSTGYYSGYYTSTSSTNKASSSATKIHSSTSAQNNSLEKLKKDFDCYKSKKFRRPADESSYSMTERSCDKCGYQSGTLDDLRLHKMAFHSQY